MKNKRAKKAVTEVLGTALLLGIAVSLFSLVQFTVFNYPFEPSPPSVSLVGTTEDIFSIDGTKTKEIIIEHLGGESLSFDTRILITIDGTNEPETTAGVCPDLDTDGSKLWNIGERFIYSGIDVTDLQVEVAVVDVESNTIIMRGIIQEGAS